MWKNSFYLTTTLCLNACQLQVESYWYQNANLLNYEVVDRVGQPYLSDYMNLDATMFAIYLSSSPDEDTDLLEADLNEAIDNTRVQVNAIAGIPWTLDETQSLADSVATFLPDLVTLDLKMDSDSQFENGISIQGGDHLDSFLSTLLGRVDVSDDQSSNREGLRTDFPFLEAPLTETE